MSKKKFSLFRFIFKALFWLILLLIIAVVAAYYYLGSLVKEAINRYVPPITGTTASVEHVDLSLLQGNIEIKGLKIGNPKGFSSNDIFSLGAIKVKFDPRSVLTDKIVINSVLISQTKVSAELQNLYSLNSNVSALQKNVEKYIGASTKKSPAKSKQPQKTETSGKKVVIKDLKIQDSELSLGVSGQTITTPLPDIHKTGIGEGKKNKSLAEIFADILDLLSVESVKGVANSVTDLAKKGYKGAKDLVSGGINTVSQGASVVSDTAKDAVSGIKGLFK